MMPPPPMPWNALKMMSCSMVVDRAQAALQMTKVATTKMRHARRPKMSHRRPHSGVPAVWVSMKLTITCDVLATRGKLIK